VYEFIDHRKQPVLSRYYYGFMAAAGLVRLTWQARVGTANQLR